jgi:hypothetical protein
LLESPSSIDQSNQLPTPLRSGRGLAPAACDSPCSEPPPQNPQPTLHGPLFVRQRDTHLFKRHFVKRAGNLDVFCCLILLESSARIVVKFAGLLAGIETAIFEDLLRLLDLILAGSKDWFPRLGRG